MAVSATLDVDLLRRYDRPGPRYTCYPTAPQFVPGFDELALREAAKESNGDPIPRPLSLYVHVPFCASPCFYCACERIVTRDPSPAAAYLAPLYREIDLVASLFDRDREVVELHFGGGTPNFMTPAQLREVVGTLRRRFHFVDAADLDCSIELDPRALDAVGVAELAATGFNRAILGVQDFDPVVQGAVNRVQTADETAAIVEACRRRGFRSVNIDLVYGLPHQTLDGFSKTLDVVLAMRADRLAIYGYAHLPRLVKAQTRIDATTLPAREVKLGLLKLAIERLTVAGYVHIGLDHFALPDDELALAQAHGSLHRNCMGYTTHADSDVIGLGISAISHIGATYSQNPRDILTWQAAIGAGRLPVFRGMRMSEDDELRAALIQHLMCQGEVPISALERRYGIEFRRYFRDALARLQPLIDDKLVLIEQDRIAATSSGRLLLRNIAMCFDAYLDEGATPARFSRAN